jgi:phosphatidylserine decarboxylase
VVLSGEWDEGFMFLTFVGAMNVGSMTVNFDQVNIIL